MNYSQITDDLFIGTTPPEDFYDELRRLGVRLVINMRLWHGRPPADGNPRIEYLRLRTFDSPLLPIPIGALVRGASEALEVMQRGGKVYTHCSRGRHRGVAMAAAILVAQGRSPEDAMKLIQAKRADADPEVFYIRRWILLFAEKWKKRKAGEASG